MHKSSNHSPISVEQFISQVLAQRSDARAPTDKELQLLARAYVRMRTTLISALDYPAITAQERCIQGEINRTLEQTSLDRLFDKGYQNAG